MMCHKLVWALNYLSFYGLGPWAIIHGIIIGLKLANSVISLI